MILTNQEHKSFLLFFSLVFTFSCEFHSDKNYIKASNVCVSQNDFIIKYGNHYSDQSRNIFTNKDVINFRASFDKSAVYKFDEFSSQNDINKLYGFSDCNTHHQENSARFGWNFINDSLKIYAYYYRNGVLFKHYMDVATIDSTHNYKITIKGNKYIFNFKETVHIATRGCSDNSFSKYILFPYFGGSEVAPHDVTIKICELE